MRYGGTLTLWLTLTYPTKNSFGGDPVFSACMSPHAEQVRKIRYSVAPLLTTPAGNARSRRQGPRKRERRRERQITAARSAQARMPPGTPDHGGKVRASENTAGNARSRRQGPRKRERRRERQKNPLLQAGFPLRYGGTLTLWLTLTYPTKNSFGWDPGLIPHKTCVLWGPRFNTPQNMRFAGTPI